MQILYTRSFHKKTRLLAYEESRCYEAIAQFQGDPWHPSLNFEPLGSAPHQNHCSIRASKELRIILAVEPDFQRPELVVLVNMGHHDNVYEWSERRRYRTDPDEGLELSQFAKADEPLQDALAALANFEEWQLFLHPDQIPLVKRQYAGEARIRGGAGTGKTVVALHRAAELGRRFPGEKVLFTTFSRSLTNQQQTLFKRMPDAPDNVDFLNIDRIVWNLAGDDLKVVSKTENDAAFDRAYQSVVPGSCIEHCGPDYLREEIEYIIKGRGASREEYLDTDRFERFGRRLRFRRAERECCWRLMETWIRETPDGKADFPTLRVLARDKAWELDQPTYRAAIVDEAQDMTLTSMQLTRALVAGKPENLVPPDGLLILDDAAQHIYTGGYRLKWANIEVTGRSQTVQINYRNTGQIVKTAAAVRGDTLLAKEDNDQGAVVPATFARKDGSAPVFIRVQPMGESPVIAKEIRQLRQNERLPLEAIGVLMHHNEDVRKLAKFLEANNIPCALLSASRHGTLGEGVRVGTFDRSKGLEFQVVFIPRLGVSIFPGIDDSEQIEEASAGDIAAETRQLQLDRLYVGMTRATDRLYLLADEEPCPELEKAYDCFEWRRQ